MRIGVLSDTHLSKANTLPRVLLAYFEHTTHIIHAGDITCIEIIQQLEQIAPVTAVAGNVDPPELHEIYANKEIIRLDSFSFGVVHGDGEKGKTLDRALECFREDDVDCIIFGHSHTPFCKYIGNRLLFNPGSPTAKRRNLLYSFGIIEIDKMISPKLVYFNSNEEVIQIGPDVRF